MVYRIFFVSLIIIFTSEFIHSQNYISASYVRGTYLDVGKQGNTFDYGSGVALEFFGGALNRGGVSLGISYYQMKNKVGNNAITASFITPISFEIIMYENLLDIGLFLFSGFDWTRMSFENNSGADNQYLWSLGGGSTFLIGKTIVIKTKVKPFYAFGNSLEQKWGILFQIGFGLTVSQ